MIRKIKSTRVQVSQLGGIIAKPKRSQQEMVGFVLIVSLVMVALMIFLVISLRKPAPEMKDANIDALEGAVLAYTTGCAINNEPDYSDFEELIGDCYDNEKCANLQVMACDYLNETARKIMDALYSAETGEVSAYELRIARVTNETEDLIIPVISWGNCSGEVRGSPKMLANSLQMSLTYCYSY